MLQKIVLAVAIFLGLLLALTFGANFGEQLLAWLSKITGLLIYNFSDLYAWIRLYVEHNLGKVLLALVLTIPVWLWITNKKRDELQTPIARRKIAIALALFFGWLGIHRFYLGHIGWGIAYLVIFYLFAPLAVIMGLIDALRYLFMSNDEFEAPAL